LKAFWPAGDLRGDAPVLAVALGAELGAEAAVVAAAARLPSLDLGVALEAAPVVVLVAVAVAALAAAHALEVGVGLRQGPGREDLGRRRR